MLEIEPLILGVDAVDPEFENEIDSEITLDEIELDIPNWHHLENHFEFTNSQNGSFYVSTAHNPVDALSLDFTRVNDNNFDVSAKSKFCFEFEGSGYRDEIVDLRFAAKYVGFSFVVPTWNEPKSIEFPPDWSVPSTEPEWTGDQILTFVSKYVDLNAYQSPEISKNKYLRLEPKIGG